MGRRPLQTSPAVASLLRRRREELGLTLREVEKRTGSFGELIPFSTLARVERGEVDPGFRRLHVLFRLYDLSPHVAQDLVELEVFADADLSRTPTSALFADGVEHWRKGNLREGLARLFALRARASVEETDREGRQRELLNFAVMVGGLGKYQLSKHVAEGLLLEPPARGLLVRVLVQIASCWHGLGSAEAALAFLGRAESHLEPRGHKDRAWVFHLKASVLLAAARIDEAGAAIETAAAAYRAAEDPYGLCRLDALRFREPFERGDFASALVAARKSRLRAEKHGYARLVTMRRLEEGRAQMALGDADAGVAVLRRALSEAITTDDTVMRFYGHYYLWKALFAAGDLVQAECERSSASHFARFVDEATPEIRELGVSKP